MSDLLHADYMKMVDAGGDLGSASARDLIEGENVSIKIEGHEIERILSDNPNPDEIVEVGTKIESRAVLAAGTRDDYTDILGGTYAAGVYTKIQGVRTLSKKDIRFAVIDTNGDTHMIDMTNMFLKPVIDQAYKLGERYYLPVEMKSSNLTQFTHDEP